MRVAPTFLFLWRSIIVKIFAVTFLVVSVSSPGSTQGLDLASGSGNQPIEIFADNGIEWLKDKEILVAKGNAKASRGQVTIEAEVLRAYYKKKIGGGTDLYRIDASGGIKIYSPKESIVGSSAVLDMGKAIFLVNGRNIVYRTENSTITANKQMEYWERQRMAVARGGAIAKHDGKTLRAAILKALFKNKKSGGSEIYLVEAFENVFIQSEKDRLRADHGIYKVKSGIATLNRNVTITRGKNILKGERAEINLNTGISKLLTLNEVKPYSGSKRRVHGLIYPQRK